MRIRMGSANTVGSKIGTSIFALIFAGFGIFFGGLMLRMMLPAFGTWFWPPTDCTIADSRFVDSSSTDSKESPFKFEVHYTYDWQGKTYQGETYKIGYSGGSDAAEPQKLVAAYPPGSTTRCYVDAKNPTRVVLRRANLWVLLSFLFPAVFVGFALLMLFMTWKSPGASPSTSGNSVIPLGKPAMSPGRTLGCGLAAFSIFAIFGLAFLIPIFVVPAWHILQARSWTETQCTIRSSEVGGHSGDKGGSTYSVDLVYTYEVGGRTYTGNRYQLMGGSSSGRAGKEAVVATLPAGSVTPCYVDPADPTSVVIDRGFGTMMWFGLIPLVFVLIGVGGMVAMVVATRRSARQKGVEQWLPGMQAANSSPGAAQGLGLGMGGATPAVSEARVLEPSQGPFAKLGCTVLIAIFVNGLVGTFFWKAILEPMKTGGSPDGCVTVILIPFGLIALGLLLSVPYQLLACFNPRPRLELFPGVLQPGKTARLRWRFTGSVSRLSRVVVTIEGTESATHRVGTSSTTSTSVFWRQTVLDAARPEELANGGEVGISVPDTLVPSFDSSNNKIVYKLKVAGTIARWPDVSEDFEIQMAPEGATR